MSLTEQEKGEITNYFDEVRYLSERMRGGDFEAFKILNNLIMDSFESPEMEDLLQMESDRIPATFYLVDSLLLDYVPEQLPPDMVPHFREYGKLLGDFISLSAFESPVETQSDNLIMYGQLLKKGSALNDAVEERAKFEVRTNWIKFYDPQLSA